MTDVVDANTSSVSSLSVPIPCPACFYSPTAWSRSRTCSFPFSWHPLDDHFLLSRAWAASWFSLPFGEFAYPLIASKHQQLTQLDTTRSLSERTTVSHQVAPTVSRTQLLSTLVTAARKQWPILKVRMISPLASYIFTNEMQSSMTISERSRSHSLKLLRNSIGLQ